jgi:ATP-dependent helicase/nuclease subunit A
VVRRAPPRRSVRRRCRDNKDVVLVDLARIYAPAKNLVLAASAGTGKTHALVGVVVHLLVGRAKPVDPSRIVATTFSRKAAAEIRARVTAELERLASAPAASPYVATLRAAAGARPLDDAEISRRARRALARAGTARFGTLHSFATGIVRTYAVEIGLGPSFELASEPDARARADEAVSRALEARLATDEAAVRSLAEAAGGVDRLVAQLRRALVQLEEDGRPARDLAIAGTDAALVEAQVERLVDHARDLRSAPKFEAAARDLLAAWSCGAGLEEAMVALCGIPVPAKKTPEVEAFGVFRKLLPGTTNEEKGRRLARAYRARHLFEAHARTARAVLADAEAAIEQASRKHATLGFGEILRAARELLRDRPDVADEVSSGIDALLVDEFQDTSRVQRDLIQLLWARRGTREAGRVPPLAAVREGGLLVVGDRKQSIYGFRGADVSVFAELAVGLAGAPAREALGIPAGVTWEPKEPHADFFALRHNRRSAPEILAFANAFSAKRFRPAEPPPQLFEIEYVPSTEDLLVPPERSSEDRVLTPKTTWLRVAPRGGASTRIEEALVAAERIRAIVASGAPAVGRERRAPSYRDIAILATTNGMLDAAAFALAQHDIPYVVAGKGFFRTREVRDLVAMLALVLDPRDKLAILEVLRGPWAAVHDETLLGLTRAGEGLVPPWTWASPPAPALVRDDDREALAAVADVVIELSRCAGRLGPGAILREAVRVLGLEDVLAALPRGAQRVANARKLLAIADRHTDARAFRAYVDEASQQELAESEAATFSDADDAVRLLTVHASKGLDFPIVIVPEIAAPLPRADKGAVRLATRAGTEAVTLAVRIADETGAILEPPSYLDAHALGRRRERAERQRLAYVAVTRAADAMFLVGGRKTKSTSEGAASIDALEALAEDVSARAAAALAVEDVEAPAPIVRRHAPGAAPAVPEAPRPRPPAPRWRSLPIAPTALADFDHCPRRFELVHVLGLPEHVRGQRADARGGGARAQRAVEGPLDARTQGTLAHAVLERVPAAVFASEEAESAASRALAAEGIPVEHAQHCAIVARVARFLRGAYARAIAEQKADVRREVPFVLDVAEGAHSVILRGNMDLVVAWPDGAVDVVDYKSARGGGPDAYAFQLDVYALALRAAFPSAARLRAGLVFLGGASGEPVWRTLPDEREVRARLARLGAALVEARWSSTFPRVALDRCEAIYCGFIGRCHADPSATVENTSPATIT